MYIVSCCVYQGWFEGEGVLLRVLCIVSRISRVVYGGGGIFKGILYRVVDTNGVRWLVGVLLRVYCIVSRIPRVF